MEGDEPKGGTRAINTHSWSQVPLRRTTQATGRSWQTRIALLAIPAVVALLFFLSGRQTLAIVVVSIGAAITTLSFVAPPVYEAINRALTSFGVLLANTLIFVFLVLLYVFVFTPISWFARLSGRDPLALRADPQSTSYWNVVLHHRKNLIERPFAYDPSSARRDGTARRALVPRLATALLFLVVINYAVGFAISSSTSIVHQEEAEWAEIGSVWAKFYAHEPWHAQLASDHFDCVAIGRARSKAYVGWVLPDCDRPTVHIEHGLRRTPNPPTNDPATLDVWFFGGSTTFGWGSRDEDTVPARFTALANQQGLPIKVTNFGTPAYVLWQEIQLFEQKIAKGLRPDLVVFYDGYNEITRQWYIDDSEDDFSGIYDGFYNEAMDKLRDTFAPLTEHSAAHYLYRKLTDHGGPPPSSAPELLEQRAAAAARGYVTGHKHLQHLSSAYGIPIVGVWQPVRSQQAKLTDLDRWDEPRVKAAFPGLDKSYARAADIVETSGVAHVIRHLVGNTRPMWLDDCHLTGEGNGLVAAALLSELGPQLRTIIDAKRAHSASPQGQP